MSHRPSRHRSIPSLASYFSWPSLWDDYCSLVDSSTFTTIIITNPSSETSNICPSLQFPFSTFFFFCDRRLSFPILSYQHPVSLTLTDRYKKKGSRTAAAADPQANNSVWLGEQVEVVNIGPTNWNRNPFTHTPEKKKRAKKFQRQDDRSYFQIELA